MYLNIITAINLTLTSAMWKINSKKYLDERSDTLLAQVHVIECAEWFQAIFWLDEVDFGLPGWVGPGLDPRLHVALPVRVGLGVPDVLQGLDVELTPHIQDQGAHLGDVAAEVPVDARALDAHEDAEVDAGPVGVGHAAVGALRVALDVVPDVLEVEDLPLAERGEDLALDGLLPVEHLLRRGHLELPGAAVQGHQQQFVACLGLASPGEPLPLVVPPLLGRGQLLCLRLDAELKS